MGISHKVMFVWGLRGTPNSPSVWKLGGLECDGWVYIFLYSCKMC
jgi:hypothetical protein